jgi:hypothetical protein
VKVAWHLRDEEILLGIVRGDNEGTRGFDMRVWRALLAAVEEEENKESDTRTGAEIENNG